MSLPPALSSPLLKIKNENHSFLCYIHNFRGIAILYIVAFHCWSSFGWGSHDLEKTVWNSLVKYGTVLFVFIAGFLFQHLNGQVNRRFSFSNYLEKKVAYVILPYILASVPAIVDKLYFSEAPFSWMPAVIEQSNPVVQVGYMLITGKHFGPFWFIPMVSLIYLLAPLLLYLDRSTWFYRYGFPLLLVAGFFSYRFGHNSSVFESLWYFIPVYVFGMWASRYRKSITDREYTFLILLGILYTVITYLEVVGTLTIFKTYAHSDNIRASAHYFNFGKIKALALCIILLVGLHKFQKVRFTLWGVLASYSFGIYFVHLYVIRSLEILLSKFNIVITFNSLLYFTHVGVVMLTCVAIIKLIKFITKKNSRYFIGC